MTARKYITGTAVCKTPLTEAVEEASRTDRTERFRVALSLTLAPMLFDAVAKYPCDYQAFLTDANAQLREMDLRELHCVKLVSTDGRVAYVDTQGYDYARYFIVPA